MKKKNVRVKKQKRPSRPNKTPMNAANRKALNERLQAASKLKKEAQANG